MFQLCITELRFNGEKVIVYKDKGDNEQGFWLDDYHGMFKGLDYISEMKIKNGKIISTGPQ